jgi:hypothetical protein
MRKGYGDLRYWLWSTLPLLHVVALYGLVFWAACLLGHPPARRDLLPSVPLLYSRLDLFVYVSLLGMIVSLGVWPVLNQAYSCRLHTGAIRLHNALYSGGWLLNLGLLFTDPGRFINWYLG